MRIILPITVILMVACLTACAEPVSISGDFGRAWISNYLAKNPSPIPQENKSSSSGSWGNSPKVQGTVDSNMVSQQNATNSIKPVNNWLGDPTNLEPSSSLNNTTQVPFLIVGGQKPIHAMDASWNHTAQIPQPDSNGLIHGWDAETYDAIGPALESF